MTSNQIAYNRHLEEKRHNVQTERLGYDTLGETSRHNVATEQIGRQNIGLGYATLGETTRHNQAVEDYQSILSLANASKADADAQYVGLQVEHYLDELKVKQDQAEAALKNATSNEERVEIERELAEIKQEMVVWEKFRIGAEGFKDILTGVRAGAETAETVVGILDRNKPKDYTKGDNKYRTTK